MTLAVALSLLSCAVLPHCARPEEVNLPPCSANDVLHLVGTALSAGDSSVLQPVILRADDLFPSNAGKSADEQEQRKDFDSESLQRLADTFNVVVSEYKGARVQAVRLGPIDRRVVVEGTDLVLDRMRGGIVVFDRGGRQLMFTGAALVSTKGCWKLEHLGAGVAEPAHIHVQERSLRPLEETGFRPFASDFCLGLSIYSSGSSDSKIGTLVEGYRRYKDPKTARVFEAVLVQSLATGHVRGVWLSHEQLASTFVDRSDHALQDCKWSTREEEVLPLPEESPALVPRRDTR